MSIPVQHDGARLLTQRDERRGRGYRLDNLNQHCFRVPAWAVVDAQACRTGHDGRQGDAAAKAELALSRPEYTDVLLGWTILGDPTAVVQP